MTTAAFSLFRTLLIYCICVPLAIILGYLISTPLDVTSFAVVGLVICFLLVPLLLRWHHVWLIASWNMSVVLFFLPGSPVVWLALAWISFTISFVTYIMNRKHKFLHVPEMVKPLMLLVVITLITAKFRGGMGLQAFGSDTYGGKRYLVILTSIVGYFALISQRIPAHKVPFYVALFFLSTITIAIGELAVVATPGFYFLFWMFPVGSAGLQAIYSDPLGRPGFASRLSGLATAGSALYMLMLCRYGIENLFSWRRVGRLGIFLFCLFVAMLGGFRSIFILFLLTFVLLFYLEGLMRSPLLPAFLIGALVVGTAIIPLAIHLPFAIQRSLSFLPIPIDPMVKAGADASTEWRVEMWRHVLPEIPDYLLLGKGYTFSAKDMAQARIGSSGTAGTELAGDYHSGPLSVIIPFGIPGTIAFLWFLAAGVKVLRYNYLYGDAMFKRVNTFLLAHFLAKAIFFFAIFGSLYNDLQGFIGLLALSISINGGMARPVTVPQPRIAFNRFKLQPPTTRPVSA